MKVYTSYFGNQKRLHADGVVPICIALYTPKWYNGIEYKKLAPRAFMLKGDLTQDEYVKCYKKYVLANLNAADVISDIKQLSKGKDCALLCYEKPGDFCHRRLAAEWLSKMLGIEVDEYPNTPAENKPEEVQTSLF